MDKKIIMLILLITMMPGIAKEARMSEGDGNLLRVLRANNKPLWFFFFNKATGNSIYMQVEDKALDRSSDEFEALSNDQIFCKISRANADLRYLLNHTDEGNATFNGKAFNDKLAMMQNAGMHPLKVAGVL